jgi:chromate transporter
MALAAQPEQPSFRELLKVFSHIGVLSFGGPAAQIALMHRELVDKRSWLDERTFAHALNFCMLLPGPEAMQLATYAGWRLHGIAGGMAAGLLFVLPGAAVVMALAMLYGTYGTLPWVVAAFTGIKAAVLIIVLQALLKVARRALVEPLHWTIALFSFVALFVFAVPFPFVILAAALAGLFLASGKTNPTAETHKTNAVDWSSTATTIALWLVIWWTPVGAAAVLLGPNHVLTELGLFFSKLAVVTFGGAYSVLTYMAQEVVQERRWLSAGEMFDGLGLAETTPGPLILVTQFVGYLAAVRQGGVLTGLLGAAMTLWVTFTPCFLWIFAGAPFIERLRGMPMLAGALAGITAAVVGVILNLSIWFSLHVLFAHIDDQQIGPAILHVPVLTSFQPLPAALSLIAALLLLWRGWGIGITLVTLATLSLGLTLSAPVFGRM